MFFLLLSFGALVGFSLGLTGGGGAIFAVPLLVYGAGASPHEAVATSLVSVGATALVGLVQRARRGLVEFPTGLLFAAAGMIGAPVGSWIARRTPEPWLLGMFAALMLVVAVRMWMNSNSKAGERGESPRDSSDDEYVDRAARTEDGGELDCIDVRDRGASCRRDSTGRLRLTSRCAMTLAVIGLMTGVLAGLFGVGGGFVIVPALVMFTGMSMQRAIGTSLLAIALISLAGVAGHAWTGEGVDPKTALLFTVGGVSGLVVGGRFSQWLTGPSLQRAFSLALLGVAAFVVWRTLH